MMASVQPATHSRFITNEYFLCTRTAYSGCTCCSDLPDARLPLTIVPMVNPACFGFQPPDDYEPMDIGFFKCDLAHDA